MSSPNSLAVSNLTRKKVPPVNFKKIKEEALGKSYELSLVFCGDDISDHNVLTYPLSKSSGEIFINLSRVAPFTVEKLFIHGLFHLKGLKHGRTMEKAEQALLNVASHRRWY